MNRRTVLKQLAVMTGGMVLVPSCDFSRNDILSAYDQLKVTRGEVNILAKLCETIIPSGEAIKGADDLHIKNFVLVMMNDCYSKDDQMAFTKGLKNFNAFTRSVSGKSFEDMDKDESKELVLKVLDKDIDTSKFENNEEYTLEDINSFVNRTKQLTVQGFMASEYIMTGIMPYQLVPGGFSGKVKIKEGEKVNVNG